MRISKGAVNRILFSCLPLVGLLYPAETTAKNKAGFYLAELRDGENVPIAHVDNGNLAPVGSLLKPFAALYLLENGLDSNLTILCPPERKRSDELRCWTPAGHGATDLAGALVQSCNYYFLSLYKGKNLNHYETWLRENFLWPENLRISRPVQVYGYDLPAGIQPAKLAHMYARLWKLNESGDLHATMITTALRGICRGTLHDFCNVFGKQKDYELVLGKTGTVHEGTQPYGIAILLIRNTKTNRKLLLLCYERRRTGAQAALNAMPIFRRYRP